MRVQLQRQGIVLILFAMLLVLVAMALPGSWGFVQWVFIGLALLFGILGLILSLSKENSDKR